MTTLHTLFVESVQADWMSHLNSADIDRRRNLAIKIYGWVRKIARKKARISITGTYVYVFDADSTKDLDKTDLPAKLDLIKDQLDELTRNVRFTLVDGKVSAESLVCPGTLFHLQYGSDWFDPHPDIVGFMVRTL